MLENGKQHQHGASNGYGHGHDKVLLMSPDCRTCLAARMQEGLLPTMEAREPVGSCEEAWPGLAATPNATQLQLWTSQPFVTQNQSPPRLAWLPLPLVRSRALLSHGAVQAVTRKQRGGCILDDARSALLHSRPSWVSHSPVSPAPEWWKSCALVVTCSPPSLFASLVWQRHTGAPVSPQARVTMRLLPRY